MAFLRIPASELFKSFNNFSGFSMGELSLNLVILHSTKSITEKKVLRESGAKFDSV